MTCSHCCDTNKFFDTKNAEKELKKYVKSGPKGATKKLLVMLSCLEKKEKSLLDIGGGVGILQWEFLKEQAASTTDVDAASSYLKTARAIAKEFGYEDKTSFIQKDFNDIADQLGEFDFVALDKVVCCYPDYQKILINAASKSKNYLVLTYPISNIFSRALNTIGRLYFLIKKSEFKTYIHPSKKIVELVENQGFKIYNRGISFPWNVQVFERV